MSKEQLKVLAFGMVAEKINATEIFLRYVKNSDELLQILFFRYPQLREVKFTVSVNRKVIHANCALRKTDEIGLLPPFAGG